MEPRPKPISHLRTRSLDQTLPYIGELMKYGQITLGNVRPVGCVAVAHDGRQTVSMLLRREGETVPQLLTRLDLAIAKALTEGIRTDEVNPIMPSEDEVKKAMQEFYEQHRAEYQAMATRFLQAAARGEQAVPTEEEGEFLARLRRYLEERFPDTAK